MILVSVGAAHVIDAQVLQHMASSSVTVPGIVGGPAFSTPLVQV